MLIKTIQAYGQKMTLACDGKCDKAWGINNRPKVMLSDDEDDYAFLADGELGAAPVDPGTYEGGHAKPTVFEVSDVDSRRQLNKWCFRECERSKSFPLGEETKLRDCTVRQQNIPEPIRRKRGMPPVVKS